MKEKIKAEPSEDDSRRAPNENEIDETRGNKREVRRRKEQGLFDKRQTSKITNQEEKNAGGVER